MAIERYPGKESAFLELKREIPKSDQIVKTIIGFCNQHGGKLVIGVNDDRSICGVPEAELDECLQWVEKSVYESSCPPIIPRVSILRIGDKNLLELEVSSGMNKPYYRRSEGLEKGTYVRLGSSTVRATPEMLEELRWRTARIRYEEQAIYSSTLDQLNDRALRVFLDALPGGHDRTTDAELLQSYGLAVAEHAHVYPTVAGILLFGERPQVRLSEAMIICTHFRGTEGRDVVATIDATGTLFEQFRLAYDFLLTHLPRSFVINGPRRQESLEIPEEAIREVLLNAIVHRNYHHPAPTKVAIWADRVEIFSPGGFPGPIDVNQLRSGRTYLRNPNICRLFREAGYIEKFGSGFITILDSYQDAGLPKPQVIDGGDYVKCILPRPRTVDLREKTGDLAAEVLSELEVSRELSVKELTKLLGVSRSTLGRTLKELVTKGLVERIGKTRSVRYRKAVR